MIKVNLLDSVTERSRSAAVVEEKVANPRMRFWLLGAAVFGLLGVGMLIDYVSLEAERKEVEVNMADYDPKDGPFDPTYRPETFRFKVKCKYGPSAPPPAAP